MRIANTRDFAFAILLLLVSAFLFHETFYFRKVAYFSIGPTAFPRVILGSLFLLAGCLLYQSLDFGSTKVSNRQHQAALNKKSLLMQVGFIALIFIYVGLLTILGYLAASMLFMVTGMLLLGKRDLKSVVTYLVISSAVALLLQHVFQNMLHLFLP